jgi:hypothetical protein
MSHVTESYFLCYLSFSFPLSSLPASRAPRAPARTTTHLRQTTTTGEPPLPGPPPQPVASHRAGRRPTHHRAPPQIHGESRSPLRTLCSTSLSDHAPLRRTSLSSAPWRTPTAPPHSLLELLARDTGLALRQVPLGIPGCSSSQQASERRHHAGTGVLVGNRPEFGTYLGRKGTGTSLPPIAS